MQQYNTTTSEGAVNFKYIDTNDPNLTELRQLAVIVIDTNADELEKVKTILGYAHSLFKHNGDNQPSALDPVTIIKEALSGKEFRCVEYSLLATALLWAHAIPARVIGLKTEDVETREYGAGHVVVEFWSNELQKWVMCDVQAGIIPKSEDRLLSAFELGEEVKQGMCGVYVPVKQSRFSKSAQAYTQWIKEYLYFYDTPIITTISDVDLPKQKIVMLIPLNTKFPVMFQGVFTMNALYTHSVIDFYAKPA